MRPEEIWESFARERGYRFTPATGYPNFDLAIDAHVDGIDVALTTRVQKQGYETRARATARQPMAGRAEIRTADWTDAVSGLFRVRISMGEADLDARLAAFVSSAALLRSILAPLTIATLRAFHDKQRFALVYEDGAITLRWSDVETSPQLLEAAARLAAHLAVVGSEIVPYR